MKKFMSRLKMKSVIVASLLIAAGTAYAAHINNPGSVSFGGNGDSKITSYGGGGNMFINAGNMAIGGSMDVNGDMFFDQIDIVFDAGEDANGYRTQLQAISDGTGTYCPVVKSANISFSARIRVTKVAGTSISTTPCYITINSGNAFTLTTDDSGSLTGARFTAAEPKLVAEVPLSGTVTGTCTLAQKNSIATYYGLGGGPSASITLFQASITPNTFTGSGC